jgi:type I restriction enzyme S subunit
MPRADWEHVAEAPVWLPASAVQDQIANADIALEQAGRLLTRCIAAKREQKRGLMQQLLTGKVRFPGFTEPWKTVPMASMIMLDSPGAWGDAPTGSNPGVIVLRSTNISDDGQIVLRSTISRVLDPRKRAALSMQCGDILLERSGGTDTRPVGRVAFARTAIDACFSNFLQRLRPDKTAVDPRFLFLQLLQLHASGATNRLQAQTTGIRNLMYRAYLKYLLPLPALDEQACICDAFDAVTDEMELLVEQREAFAMQRRGLMERLLSGDISIPFSDTFAA